MPYRHLRPRLVAALLGICAAVLALLLATAPAAASSDSKDCALKEACSKSGLG